MAEVDETIKRIQTMSGVKGIMITNSEGIVIKSSGQDNAHLSYTMKNVVDHAARVVKDLDGQNDLTMVRLHTKKYEIMCCTEPPHNSFMMTVIHETGKDDGHCD